MRRRCMVCKVEWVGAGVLPVECPGCGSSNTAPVVELSGRIRLMPEFGGRPLTMWERFRATLQSERSGASVRLLVVVALALGLLVYAVVR